MFDIISPLYVYRLGRRREYDRARRAAMTPKQRETVLQQRRDRRAMMREEQTDRQTVQLHSRPQSEPQSRNISTLKINDPNVIQRIQHVHRTLFDLHNQAGCFQPCPDYINAFIQYVPSLTAG